ncbi:transcriptional regulator, TetR family [Cohaesibacter sp. ES.047]|uniref:TetR/AcrR family transcriptional regulator n=1 Tax=Cohaesibacter sp. ES.047 TaxID=1798205 RepID=UPI000BB83783|nr:TetR/AcrR family transcriptional regulator [Cohaesibacter sp. ES.047]SNY92674.1 transcriptional regulator, TetR family [Cohaesibacter sp. ES.047]
MAKTRFKKEDWIQLGLDVLKSDGPSALTVENLCLKANRTRGSFYHHFADHDAFLIGLAEHWRQHFNLAFFERLTDEPQGVTRLSALNTMASDLDLGLEVAIRQLAQRSEPVAQLIHEIDQMRLDYLEQIYLSMGRDFAVSARQITELEYASFLGAILLWPDMGKDRQQAFAKVIPTMLGLIERERT